MNAEEVVWYEVDESFVPPKDENLRKKLRKKYLNELNILRENPPDHLTDSDQSRSGSKVETVAETHGLLNAENDFGWFEKVLYADPWSKSVNPYRGVVPKKGDIPREPESKLTAFKISNGLNTFERIPLTSGYALTKLELPDENLTNIELLSNYKYLQYLDLSYNRISDVTALCDLMYLIVLDLSHNLITELGFTYSPWFLTYLNLSHNQFDAIPDISAMWALKHLNMSDNEIGKIEHIRNLSYLEYLNLSHNRIEVIEVIEGVPLKELDLSWNQITHATSELGTFKFLDRLNLSHNNIATCSAIESFSSSKLSHLDLSFNKFESVMSFDALSNFKSLRYLKLQGNDIFDKLPGILDTIIYQLPQLIYLNGKKLETSDRYAAYGVHHPNVFISQMKKYAFDLLLNDIEPQPYGTEPIECSSNPGLVVLVGPAASFKKVIASKLVEMFPKNVRKAKLCTTMYPVGSYIDVRKMHQADNYVYMEKNQFHKMWSEGKFVITHNVIGTMFGLPYTELENDGRICLLTLPIDAAIKLKWLGLNPTFILTLVQNRAVHANLLKKFFLSAINIEKERRILENLSANKLGVWSESSSYESERIFAEDESPSQVQLFMDRVKEEEIATKAPTVQSVMFSYDKDLEVAADEEEGESEYRRPSLDFSVLRMTQDELKYVDLLMEWELNMREQYVTARENGLFVLCVDSSNVQDSVNAIIPVLKSAHASLHADPPADDPTKDPLYSELVEPHIEEMMQILSDRLIFDFEDSSEDDSWSTPPSQSSLTAPLVRTQSSALTVTLSTSDTVLSSPEIPLAEPTRTWDPPKIAVVPSNSDPDLIARAVKSMTENGYDLKHSPPY